MSQIYDVAIIGAGSSGICAAIQLKKIGLENFIILEKGDDVGGTWFWNRYPGAECDVQSHLYSFSFEPNQPGLNRSLVNKKSDVSKALC